ncbi:MAG: cysteine desulfurase family protein [Coriobacteriales bacterium]|nr:cysteine desulfurase family protein [Coriobacteriales bacterium]
MSRRAYLDYAATAPFDTRLADTMAAASWANANALYTEGRAAASQLEDARKRIAVALGAHAPSELTFTSGGSESDNTAIRGLAKPVPGAKSTHVVVSSIEHDAVLNSAKALKSEGFAVDKVDPDASGIVRPEALEALLARIEDEGGAVTLVAVQAVNNELGTIQPVRALARVAHAHQARFFTDAVQGLGKLDIDLEQSGVDAAAFSAHKIGALYLRRGIRIKPLVYGGGQEAGMRSGTQNVMGALVFAQAVENAVAERTAVWERASAFRAKVLDALAAGDFAHQVRPTLSCDVAACDGPLTEQGGLAPHVLSLLVDGLEGETLVLRADNAGIAVSAGSACSSGSLDPSHVLLAIGVPRQLAFGSLRLSFGALTSEDDVDLFIEKLPEVLR